MAQKQFRLPLLDAEKTIEDTAEVYETLAEMDAKGHMKVCWQLGVEPDKGLSERFEADRIAQEILDKRQAGYLDELCLQEDVRKHYQNNPPSAHNTRSNMQSYLEKIPSLVPLSRIYHGMHNIDISAELYNRLDMNKLISLYHKVHERKQHDSHLEKAFSDDFEKLFYQIMKTDRYKDSTKTNTRWMELASNLDRGLNKETKQRFVGSFKERYKPSLRESDHGSYADPGTIKGYVIDILRKHNISYVEDRGRS